MRAWFVVLFWLFIAVLGPFITAWAWNNFVPVVWHAAPHLTYWSALAFNVLLATIKGGINLSGGDD